MRTSILSVVVAAVLAPSVRSQGSDACAQPQVVAGSGPHAFDNSTATADSATLPCGPIGRDVWFVWTAPSTASFNLTTCGQASIDTLLAVYAGTPCPLTAPIACDDDACSTQSLVSFAATAGASYVVRIGSYGESPGGAGTFTIASSSVCGVVAGPDLVIGDITGPANFAPTGELDAIALGVVTCNVGTVWASWFANTNQHPVIGGNLYRYRVVSGSGRFEQIGMSWLLHGFFALSQSLCCTGCTATNGEHLGVGCSDPSTASRAGTQQGAGPRWQVNASTGAFSYPPASPAWSGTTARRLQFLASDVDTTPGVRWFGEVHVVSPDDAAAGNGDNNASHRELSTNGTSFQLAGPTRRLVPAIEAWAACEPGVTIAKARVAGDGLFHVGSKVTSLGGGQYHYEYAVHNLNSHRSGGTFSVPVGVATVTNVEFHDVDYRNGDGEGSVGFAGTDWTVTSSGGVLTWAAEPQASNANANALRWGTTYNFRFDADASPIAGVAEIGLWRPGTPTAAGVGVVVPDASPPGVTFCAGDGSGAACPCSNSGIGGHGCANSVNADGARLTAAGVASVLADTLVLSASGMPNSSALFFQGTSDVAGGVGAPFGDGLRCASGTTTRLGVKSNVGGASAYPTGTDTAISVRGANSAGDVRTYQVWYRNSAAFCTSATFNLTNGRRLTWSP